MSEAIVLALIAAIPAFLGVALTAVLHYGRQSVRDVVDTQKELLDLTRDQRDMARADVKDRDERIAEKDRLIAEKDKQIRGLEEKVGHYEGRPTRGGE